jgi:hypothetical protein
MAPTSRGEPAMIEWFCGGSDDLFLERAQRQTSAFGKELALYGGVGQVTGARGDGL